MGERTSHPLGSFCWVDLAAADPEAAKAFYGEVLGWQFEDLPGTAHALAGVGGRAVAAVGPLPDPSVTPHFNCFVSVRERRRGRRARGGARRVGACWRPATSGRPGAWRSSPTRRAPRSASGSPAITSARASSTCPAR